MLRVASEDQAHTQNPLYSLKESEKLWVKSFPTEVKDKTPAWFCPPDLNVLQTEVITAERTP